MSIKPIRIKKSLLEEMINSMKDTSCNNKCNVYIKNSISKGIEEYVYDVLYDKIEVDQEDYSFIIQNININMTILKKLVGKLDANNISLLSSTGLTLGMINYLYNNNMIDWKVIEKHKYIDINEVIKRYPDKLDLQGILDSEDMGLYDDTRELIIKYLEDNKNT